MGEGTSYPDITTLPALARILETDLNTLLSFKEELTEQEIAIFKHSIRAAGKRRLFKGL